MPGASGETDRRRTNLPGFARARVSSWRHAVFSRQAGLQGAATGPEWPRTPGADAENASPALDDTTAPAVRLRRRGPSPAFGYGTGLRMLPPVKRSASTAVQMTAMASICQRVTGWPMKKKARPVAMTGLRKKR